MTDLRKEIVDTLTEKEVERLEATVKEEEAKAARDDLRKRYKDEFRQRVRQQTGIDEAIEHVTIDCAKHSDGITINGIKYQHGQTYPVRASLAIVLRHTMQSGYEHQSEVEGHPKRYYNQSRQPKLSPDGNTVNTSQLLRV